MDLLGGENDGLPMPEVGAWSETKYQLVRLYDELFATGMKNKWGQRIYIDLYAGAGYAKVKGTKKILAGSPIIALKARNSFDKYIFCEKDEELLQALHDRVHGLAPSANAVYVRGDCNKKASNIADEIPSGSRGNAALGLCFVDPFNIGIRFSTIRQLASRRVDFLILLALYMDAGRNRVTYSKESSTKIDEFLGTNQWRSRWEAAQWRATRFPEFLAAEYAASMTRLGFLETPLYKMKKVRSGDKNLPLYYLALFSRSQKAHDFWRQVLKYETPQRGLFEE